MVDKKDFSSLLHHIQDIHDSTQAKAAAAVNKALTIRNWAIGFYIVEYEQNGEDRAEYGANLIGLLAQKLMIKGLTAPELSRSRQFYLCYPQILGTVSQELNDSKIFLNLEFSDPKITTFINSGVSDTQIEYP